MALIAIAGNSGKGKTTSIRNLNPEETFLIQVIPKPLPFKGWKTKYKLATKEGGNRYVLFTSEFDKRSADKEQFYTASNTLVEILDRVVEKGFKNIIVDDSQYIMSYEFMARSKERGYEKYSEIAGNFFNIIKKASNIAEDVNIVFLHHTEIADGVTKLKTSGKMIDNHITLEGLFTYVVLAEVIKENGKAKYVFKVHDDGTTTVKTPMGMFKEDYIDNDLQLLLDKIKEYEED